MKTEQMVKKGLLVGVGLVAFAKTKAEQVVKELVKKGNLNPAEGKKAVRKICLEAEKSGKRVAEVMQAELKRLIKAVNEKKGKKRG